MPSRWMTAISAAVRIAAGSARAVEVEALVVAADSKAHDGPAMAFRRWPS